MLIKKCLFWTFKTLGAINHHTKLSPWSTHFSCCIIQKIVDTTFTLGLLSATLLLMSSLGTAAWPHTLLRPPVLPPQQQAAGCCWPNPQLNWTQIENKIRPVTHLTALFTVRQQLVDIFPVLLLETLCILYLQFITVQYKDHFIHFHENQIFNIQ